MRGGVQLPGSEGLECTARGEGSDPDHRKWVKRLEPQKGSDNSPSTPPHSSSRRSINTLCYSSSVHSALPHIQSIPPTLETQRLRLRIITVKQGNAERSVTFTLQRHKLALPYR
ncbi:hypothetical protein EYF80_068027 [Liparis tanakae]|uniref:Uncharacterized protein n=1 Tax=Liparis tanakae TaxID=230148 RepID=A0A4Z2DZ77_9TELE|nr:hypothetical protein EYF80_068027 [Liparis tanakae]